MSSITFEVAQPILISSGAVVVAGLGWQALRYRFPPELFAIIATMGLPIAGLWRPELFAYTLTPSTWASLAGLLVLSIVALHTIEIRSTRDVFLLGAIAGSLPAALIAARAAPDARTAGRLAVVAAGAGAISPLGGPVQFMLPATGLDWWVPSAAAGVVAAGMCWRNPAIGEAEEPVPVGVRVRWLLAVVWAGCILQIAGVPWLVHRLASAPPDVPLAAWAAVCWVGGHFADPWLLADVGARSQALGADGPGLEAAYAGLTAPSFLPLVLAWSAKGHRAALAGIPAVILGVVAMLLLV